MKKTIFHIIYSLGRGGAETLLVRVLKELTEFNNIVITLDPANHFEEELVCDKYICINKPSLLSIPSAANKLRKLISEYQPDLVHSHLPLSNFVARLATPAEIPLVTTIHNSIATSKDYSRKFIRMLDRVTYMSRPSFIIGVSKGALQDYFSVLKLKPGKTFLLYNFVDTRLYSTPVHKQNSTFRVVCVAALSVKKNIG